MDASFIKGLLHEKYGDRNQWACFDELRNQTGYSRQIKYIDFFVINLYPSKNFQRIAYEIKVSKGDFNKEIADPGKRKFAMDNSNQFYFICPSGLISKDEVPEDCGLMYVNSKNSINTRKVAKDRALPKTIDLTFFASLTRRSQTQQSLLTDKVFKYAGKELTRDEFKKIVDEKVQSKFKDQYDWHIRREVEEKYQKKYKEFIEREQEVNNLFNQLQRVPGEWMESNEAKIQKLQKMVSLYHYNKNIDGEIQQLISMLQGFLTSINENRNI